MSAIKTIGTSEFEEQALNAKGLVLVDFSATWCGPCKRMLPELEAAAQELGSNVSVLKVDVDESPEIANRYGVQGIPNLTFFKDGKVVDVQVGAIPRAAIVSRAKKNLSEQERTAKSG
ncbi:MAG TPA: thioredoxin [Fimbriimonas sp.]|nr:thioredoxin [Fimbriimonas sp.]